MKFKLVESLGTDLWEQIYEFNKKLNSYDYQFYDENKNKITPDEADEGLYVTLSPEDFEELHGGVCIDYVAYESNYFRENFPEINYKNYCIASNDDYMENMHTFLTFEFDDNYYWFESSWKDAVGLHEYDSEEDLLDDIKNKRGNSIEYLLTYDATDNSLYNIPVEEFVEKIINIGDKLDEI